MIYTSSVISSRLLKMLKEHRIEEQLAYQPLCRYRDLLFIVCSALQLQQAYPTYMGIVCQLRLVKAFDTVD
jgi:hypothetical protein